MGSTEETLELTKRRVGEEFPRSKIVCHSPPFKDIWSKKGKEAIISEINTFSPDVLFVGITAPKQEKVVGPESGQTRFSGFSLYSSRF